MKEVFNSPISSLMICLISFEIGIWINRKTKIAVLNPLLLAICIGIVVINLLSIPIEVFEEHTKIIHLFLGPATVVLAVPMYSQRALLKAYKWPIIISTGIGALTAVISVVGLSYLFGIEGVLRASFIPKSVTTPIAIEVAKKLGGIPSLAVAAVIITGITGAVLAPALISLYRLKDEVAIGLAIGTSSHAMGTTKAIELGEVQGALSGLAIGVTGIFTVLISLFL